MTYNPEWQSPLPSPGVLRRRQKKDKNEDLQGHVQILRTGKLNATLVVFFLEYTDGSQRDVRSVGYMADRLVQSCVNGR